MKKIFLIFWLLGAIFLCSCKSRNELGENDIITTFYVDFKEDLYEISAEIIDFSNKENSFIKTAYASSLPLAYENLIKSLNKKPYIGHAEALVLGIGICENSLYETINFFSDINIISPNISVMFSEDSPNDFMPNSIYNSIKNKTLFFCPLYSLFLPYNKTVFIPVVSSFENEAKNVGGAIFEDFIFKLYIPEKESEIYRLLTNSFGNDYYNSNEILKSKSKIKNKDENLKINLKLEIKNLTEKEDYSISQEIKKDTENFIEKLRENNLFDLIKKGDFKSFEIHIDLAVSDNGKLKKEEE